MPCYNKKEIKVWERFIPAKHWSNIQLVFHPDDFVSSTLVQMNAIRLMEDLLDVIIHACTEIVQVPGRESAWEARQVIQALMVLVNRDDCRNSRTALQPTIWFEIMKLINLSPLTEEEIIKDNTGKLLRVKTLAKLCRYVKHHDVTFGIGPAGTVHLFLAVTLVNSLKRTSQTYYLFFLTPIQQ